MQTINEMVTVVHNNAKEKGWWESQREAGTILMLIVSEIAEAMEEARNNTPPIYIHSKEQVAINPHFADIDFIEESLAKPEGELIELADAVIRIMDYCGSKGWDLERAIRMKIRYNLTRPHRHGGKAF